MGGRNAREPDSTMCERGSKRNYAPVGRSVTAFHFFADILRASASPREISLADFVRDPERLSAAS
ncbi:MAG: hypothetical protein IKX40_06290 [Thermoguttaceae bacterium]|nr:hypothetical protein [Thermoguttaceae bacterium]